VQVAVRVGHQPPCNTNIDTLVTDSTVNGDENQEPTGKAVLPSMVNGYRAEYYAMPAEQKAKLISELDEHKASQKRGLRVSTRARVNDVTHTLKVVENEVHTYSYI
jgi:hypothetical protein